MSAIVPDASAADLDGLDPAHAARVRDSWNRQALLATLGARLLRVGPGIAEIELPVSPHVAQQHGFVHAGAVATIADTACGYAALTTMDADSAVLTAEFKINLMAPAAGERLVARARVVRSGRTLTVALCEVEAEAGGSRKTVALMTATLASVRGKGLSG
jgi:uncharacterized protein (TIGR00369 family)